MSNMEIDTKVCVKCSGSFALEYFHNDKSSSDGKYKYCKKCQSEYAKSLYAQGRTSASNGEYRRSSARKRKLRALQVVGGTTPRCFYNKEYRCCVDECNLDYLTLDHVKGNGLRHRRDVDAVGGSSFYSWVLRNRKEAKKTLVCSCMNAQFIRRYNERQS